MFFGVGQHDYKLNILLVDHAPEVLLGGRQWTLGRDEHLIVASRA